MHDTRKIALNQIPAPVAAALTQQLVAFGKFDVQASPDEADLIISGAPLDRPGAAVLGLSFARPLRLGTLLRQIGQVLAEPVLYMSDMPVGDYTFRPQEKMLARGDDEISLTDREVDILAYLARHRGGAISRDELLRNVWQYNEGVDTHTLETHIYRLRQKIEKSADDPQILQTVEGGYRLA